MVEETTLSLVASPYSRYIGTEYDEQWLACEVAAGIKQASKQASTLGAELANSVSSFRGRVTVQPMGYHRHRRGTDLRNVLNIHPEKYHMREGETEKERTGGSERGVREKEIERWRERVRGIERGALSRGCAIKEKRGRSAGAGLCRRQHTPFVCRGTFERCGGTGFVFH